MISTVTFCICSVRQVSPLILQQLVHCWGRWKKLVYLTNWLVYSPHFIFRCLFLESVGSIEKWWKTDNRKLFFGFGKFKILLRQQTSIFHVPFKCIGWWYCSRLAIVLKGIGIPCLTGYLLSVRWLKRVSNKSKIWFFFALYNSRCLFLKELCGKINHQLSSMKQFQRSVRRCNPVG